MFATIVHHFPKPEHREAFMDFCREIGDRLRGTTEGLLSIEGFHDVERDRLTIVGRWESAAAAVSGVAKLIEVAAQAGPRDPAWSRQDDEVMRMQAF